jgi:hypothetical protein
MVTLNLTAYSTVTYIISYRICRTLSLYSGKGQADGGEEFLIIKKVW